MRLTDLLNPRNIFLARPERFELPTSRVRSPVLYPVELRTYYHIKVHLNRSSTLVAISLTIGRNSMYFNMVPLDNFEMSAFRLSSECSSSELQGQNWRLVGESNSHNRIDNPK
jgi:hypothetical protein